LKSSPSIVKIRWARHAARMGANKYAYRILVRNPDGKRLLGRPRRRQENNIKLDLREIGWVNMD
jgi:hypothetical protein